MEKSDKMTFEFGKKNQVLRVHAAKILTTIDYCVYLVTVLVSYWHVMLLTRVFCLKYMPSGTNTAMEYTNF